MTTESVSSSIFWDASYLVTRIRMCWIIEKIFYACDHYVPSRRMKYCDQATERIRQGLAPMSPRHSIDVTVEYRSTLCHNCPNDDIREGFHTWPTLGEGKGYTIVNQPDEPPADGTKPEEAALEMRGYLKSHEPKCTGADSQQNGTKRTEISRQHV